jgi:hypothetical protein
MHIAVIDHEPALSAYLAEILTTWGVRCCDLIDASAVNNLNPLDVPVVIVPAMKSGDGLAASLAGYAQLGGTVICMKPDEPMAELAGLTCGPDRNGPMRLRLVAAPRVGPAGGLLVVVPPARSYERQATETGVLAFLSPADQYDGESVGVTRRQIGQGRIIALAFDLPRCLMLLRQGTPDRREVIPEGIAHRDACARASHLALEIGGAESAWSPFADLLCDYLVALVRRHVTVPLPLLSHLPGEAPGIVLLSGDEDYAPVSDCDYQMGGIADLSGRMNLYVIPEATQSTPQDVSRYRLHHDVGVHPNLRPLDGRPAAERIADFERQVRLFAETFDMQAMSVRNHCFAWAGYLELIEAQQRCGVRMDTNFFSGAYARHRRPEPFFPFGSAMPMRFCRPDGRLIDVFQQHTHICDDMSFCPDKEYSYKYTPDTWATIFERILDDMLGGGHFPLTFNFHPSNWRLYAEPCGHEVLRQAAGRGVPAWSIDQWCRFWTARDTWRIENLTYRDGALTFSAAGSECHDQLRWLLPTAHNRMRLAGITVDGRSVPITSISRYGESMALVAPEEHRCQIQAQYQTVPAGDPGRSMPRA